MKTLTRSQQGELYMLGEVLLWSLFPIVSIFALNTLSPLLTASLSTLSAAAFFAIVLTVKKCWKELKTLSALRDTLIATLFIGIGFYSLLFIGIGKTTAGDASIMLLMELFFGMVVLWAWGKERYTMGHIIGSLCMVIGAFLVLFQGSIALNSGNLIILIATALPPIGNFFAQRARKKVSSAYIMFVRSIISGIFLLVLSLIWETIPTGRALETSVPYLLINGLVILGLSKVFWIEAIHRIPITKGLALGSITPVFTLIAAYVTLHEVPRLWQIIGLIPIIFGVWLLTDFGKSTDVSGSVDPPVASDTGV